MWWVLGLGVGSVTYGGFWDVVPSDGPMCGQRHKAATNHMESAPQ